jgi:hypothetical protein
MVRFPMNRTGAVNPCEHSIVGKINLEKAVRDKPGELPR